ncbi:MAG: cache domain-containing protein [Spirochaetota bacterium]
MKKCVILILMFWCVSCTMQQRPVSVIPVKTDSLSAKPDTADYTDVARSFLSRCEHDINASSQIISEKRLIKSLSHLNHMGSGGTYYYLLEKDAITRMLQKLASYTYSECYLIDTSGRIVYTMYNDDLIGRKVSQFQTSPLMPMYVNGMKNKSMIIDVTEFPALSRNYDVYFSRPVGSDGNRQGVLITAVHIKNLSTQLPESVRIVARSSGKFKMHENREMIDTKDSVYLDKMSGSIKNPGQSAEYADGVYEYQQVTYKTLSWVLVVPRTITTLNVRR